MGFLYYGSGDHSIEIEDRALAHLKVALLSLLRAGHSVAFSHARPTTVGGGWETIWVSPSSELRFRFRGGRSPDINEKWVQAIIATADGATGLRLIAEPYSAINVANGIGGGHLAPPPEKRHKPSSRP